MRRLLPALGVLVLTAAPAAAEPFCMTWTNAPPATTSVLTSLEIVGEGSQYFALAGRAAIADSAARTVTVRGLIGSAFVGIDQAAVLSFADFNPDGTAQGVITLTPPGYTSGQTGRGAPVSVVTCPVNFPSPSP